AALPGELHQPVRYGGQHPDRGEPQPRRRLRWGDLTTHGPPGGRGRGVCRAGRRGDRPARRPHGDRTQLSWSTSLRRRWRSWLMNPGFLIAALTLLGAGELHAQMPRPIPDGAVREGTLRFDGRATTGAFTGTTATVRGHMSGGGSLSEVRGWVDAPVS